MLFVTRKPFSLYTLKKVKNLIDMKNTEAGRYPNEKANPFPLIPNHKVDEIPNPSL